jgi:hypothetical protein
MPDREYVSEQQLHMRLASSMALWRKLGFKSPPQIEIWSEDRTCRYGVIGFGERLVVEVELEGDVDALAQVLRYLDNLRDETGQRDSCAHIVVVISGDTALRRATAKHVGIALWKCELRDDGNELVRLAWAARSHQRDERSARHARLRDPLGLVSGYCRIARKRPPIGRLHELRVGRIGGIAAVSRPPGCWIAKQCGGAARPTIAPAAERIRAAPATADELASGRSRFVHFVTLAHGAGGGRVRADAEVKRRDDSPGARFRNAGASEHLVNATPSAMTWIVHSSGGRSTA